MRLRAHFLMLAVALLWTSLGEGSRSYAQDDLEAAKAHYSKGTRLYDVGEYAQAMAEFKAAHVAKPDPAFLYNIAQCLRQVSDFEQAVVMYRRYLAASPKASNRDEVEKRVAELEARLASGRQKAESGAGPGAPAPVPVTPAPTTEPPPTAPPPVETVTAPGLSTQTVPERPSPAGGSLRTLRWVGVGLTLALAGAAVGTGLSASSKYDELKGSCGESSAGCPKGDIDKVKSRALLTNLLWGATGIAAAATGLAFYLAPHEAGVQVAWRY
jgi:tetratricopeptide (TPR) repeat protein